ncbi:MAG TPA: glycosyltransferase family 39 protein [Chthonomonadaceae bacterium]|nr:glycosyltransferase family 39 protein [Chthonomonadaceae bacterium]
MMKPEMLASVNGDMANTPAPSALDPAPSRDYRLWWGFGGVAFLLHLLCLTRYGIFRDELYYLACVRHMAWGYVDHPPLSIGVLWLIRALLGDALWAVRLPPALALAATVGLTGWLTREAGGKPGAQALAMLAALIAPIYLAYGHFFSMNALDVLLWTVALCVLMRLLPAPRLSLWLWLGLLLGLGLLNKISVLWLILGITAGLVCTPYRRLLLTAGPWIAIGIAGLLFAPHVAWEVANGWPTLEFIHNATTQKMADMPAGLFLVSQLLLMHPITAPLWLTGLFWSLTSRQAERWRVGAIAFVIVALILIVNGKSRAEYLAPGYPLLFATGAAVWEQLWEARRLRWLPSLAFGIMAFCGLFFLPLSLPVLPVESYIRFAQAIHIAPPYEEKGSVGVLPQHYADMYGWEELTAAVADVYRRLPPDEQADCAILTNNYGEAGAIDYFGRRYGLPHALCGQNNYWLWGTHGWKGQTLIVVNTMSTQKQEQFESVQQMTTVPNPLSMPYEQDIPLYVARQLKTPVSVFWAAAKMYR